MDATSADGVRVAVPIGELGVADVSFLPSGPHKFQISTATHPPLLLGGPFQLTLPEDVANGGYIHEVRNPIYEIFRNQRCVTWEGGGGYFKPLVRWGTEPFKFLFD